MRKRVRALESTVKAIAEIRLQFITRNSRETRHSSAEACLCSRSMALRLLQVYEASGFGSCHRSDQKRSFPFAVHFSLLLSLRDVSKDEIALLDLPRSHLLVAPPSDFLLVPAKVDCCLGLDSLDRIDCLLDVFVS